MPITLSVIIPAYNMENYLPGSLSSLLEAKVLPDIEVIVVNDGSVDGTLEIADGFSRRFPDIVSVIDKPNGNYGSAVNAALPQVKGRYVKILDADDRFDTAAFTQFVKALKAVDSDIVVTHFVQIHHNGVKEVVKYNTMGREPYLYGRKYSLDEVLSGGHIRFFLIHHLTYRTSVLVEHGYRQSEGISYTDTEWASIPLYYCSTVTFLDIAPYRYNFDRPGQTMDPQVLYRSVGQLCRMTDNLLNFYRGYDRASLSEERLIFIKSYLAHRIRILYKLMLLDMPRKSFDAEKFDELFTVYDSFCVREGLKVRVIPENRILHIDLVRYWRKHHKRLPPLVESLSRALDCAARFFYIRLVRR